MPDGRLRVVYVDHCAQPSGAQLAMVRLLDALGDEVDAHVVLAEDGPLVQRLRDAGRTVEVLELDRAAQEFRGQRLGRLAVGPRAAIATAVYTVRLARRLRRLRPDLVHTNSLKAAFYGSAAARLARIPAVVQFRDRLATDFLPPLACRLTRAAARRLPTAIVAYEDSLSTLAPNPRPQLAVVDPVEPAFFDVHRRQPAAADDGGNGPLRVGMVGRVVSWKGQHVFLEAFASAFGDGDEKAVIVGSALLGDEGYEESLRRQVVRLGLSDRVEFTGFRADVAAELASLDIVVHASVIPEPFGQVVTEAMAAGVPVIAARAGGPARMITPGVDGLLTQPGDASGLADALRELGSDPGLRTRLAAAARSRAASAFTNEVVAAQVLGAYHTVLAAGRSSGRSHRALAGS